MTIIAIMSASMTMYVCNQAPESDLMAVPVQHIHDGLYLQWN